MGPLKNLNNKGVTLIEILTICMVIGIALGIFYSVLFVNWQNFDEYVVKANLSQDMDIIVEQISKDTRFAKEIVYTTVGGNKQITLKSDKVGDIVYEMTTGGQLTVTRGATTVVLTQDLDFTQSAFNRQDSGGINIGNDSYLALQLALSQTSLFRKVSFKSSTDIYVRN